MTRTGARRPYHVGLTPTAIIDVAVEATRGTGLDSWSVRDLAGRLGVATSTLYHHVGGQELLRQHVVERVLAMVGFPTTVLPWRCRADVLSQSEDQSRPHPVPGFVRPMSTQVRSLSLDTPEGAYLPDPQIATRMRIRGGKCVGKYPRCRINQAYAGRHGGHPTPLPFSRAISTVLASNKYRSRGE